MRVTNGRHFIGRFEYKSDLLEELTGLCNKERITMGVFSVIGAVTSAKMGYYNQTEKRYTECVSVDKKLEITSCIGNVSLLNGEIFVHAHITLADHEGKCYGGHLMPGTAVFAAEYEINELEGEPLVRKRDKDTGLMLW